MRLVYQIESTNDREGNPKTIPSEWRLQQYHLDVVAVGRGALLNFADNSGRCLKTSTVEDIFIFNDSVKITTRNTVYWMTPAPKGV